jgi:hypothetical protein
MKCEPVDFDIVVIDHPANMPTSVILPEALCLLNQHSYLVFRAIKQSYNNNLDICVDLPIEDWKTIISQNGFNVINYYEQPREYYYGLHWLSNYVFEVKKND